MQASEADRQAVAALVKKAQQGDSPAFAALYERYYDQMFRYVSFKCGNASEAEDLTGEVFLKMLESIHTFKWRGHPFTSWLYRIAHNLVVDHFRKKGRRRTVPLDNALSQAGVTASDLEHRAEVSIAIAEVARAMENLTDLQREVIALRFASGLSVAETAAVVGKKENAVKALQHAGLKKLRKVMAPTPSIPARLPRPEA